MTAPTADQLLNPDGDVRRDRFGRPLILLPDGTKERAYTRATTFAGSVDDLQNIMAWKVNSAMAGLALKPDLALAVLPYANDVKAHKKNLKPIAEAALEAAGAGRAARIGTAIHALTEKADRGEPLGPVPPTYLQDIAAYIVATQELNVLAIEQFVVVDEMQVGGTADRIVEYKGSNYIADVKTGSLDFAAGKIAMQLALYSRGTRYDFAARERNPLPEVDQDRAIVIHLPAGTGECKLYWIDIAAGWEAVQLAKNVREWRKRRDLLSPV